MIISNQSHFSDLGQIAEISTGKLDSNAAIEDGEYPFFTCAPETLAIDQYAFDTEAVLLAGNNASGKFNVKYYNGKFNAYQRTYVIKPKEKDKLDCKYLMYVLAMRLAEMERLSIGSTTRFLTRKILDKFEIPLPSISIQQHIASNLSGIDKAIEQAGIAIEESERMKRGLMQKLMDGCNQKTLLGNHISDIGYGYTECASDKEIGPKFLRITDLNTNDIEWNVVPYCKCNDKDFNKYRLSKGDVVFARIGATTGQAQLIREDANAVFASYLIRIKLENTLLPEYLYQFTKTSRYWNQINAQKGAHMKGGINIPSLSKLEITYPSLSEQQHIIDIQKSVDSKISLCIRRKSLLETLKRGMMQQLLSGANLS